MSNIYSLKLLPGLPFTMGAVPFGADHEFWDTHPERRKFIDGLIEDGVSIEEEEDYTLLRVVEAPGEPGFMFTANDDLGDESCESGCPAHGAIFSNHEITGSQYTRDELDKLLDEVKVDKGDLVDYYRA